MNYLKENARKLGQAIDSYCRTNNLSDNIEGELHDEMTWNAPRFYSELLYHSHEGQYRSIDFVKLYEILGSYNEAKARKVLVETLFENGLLRIVYGIIRIPATIYAAAFEVNKKERLKTELTFLVDLRTKAAKKKLTRRDFEKWVHDFENRHDQKLDLELALSEHLWYEEVDGTIRNNAEYYSSLLADWDEYLFVHHLADLLNNNGEQNQLLIEIEKLERIITARSLIYPKTPTIETLVASGLLKLIGEDYILNFQCKLKTSDKIGAILWQTLLDDESFSSDEHRIRFWYMRLIHNSQQWPEIGKFSTKSASDRFVASAIEIVTNDDDLSRGQIEYRKLLLDNHTHDLLSLGDVKFKMSRIEFPDLKNLCELYYDLEELNEASHSDLLLVQEARSPLSFFIRQIVLNDNEYGSGHGSFPQISKLLDQSEDKPFILWKVCYELNRMKPSIIPFLLLNLKTAALGFNLVRNCKISETFHENKSEIQLTIQKSAFKLLLECISQFSYDSQQAAEIIFHSLQKVVVDKFRLRGTHDIRLRKNETSPAVELCDQLRRLFIEAELPHSFTSESRSYRPLLFPNLIEELFKICKNYEQTDYIMNYVLSLPLVKMDWLTWLNSMLLSDEYISQKNSEDDFQYQIVEEFAEAYISTMNCTEIKGWNYEMNIVKEKRPNWQSHQSLNERINWHSILPALETSGFLSRFISPDKLLLEVAEDQYNEFNRFTADKIRSHLSILLYCYNSLIDKISFPTDTSIQLLLNQLETGIVFFVKKYCVDEPSKRRIDIFNDLFERPLWPGSNSELLPIVGKTMNRFCDDNKRGVSKELIKTNQLTRSLKLLEYAISEHDRQMLLSAIGSQDIVTSLKNEHSVDSINYILQELAQLPDFLNMAEEALNFWNETIANNERRTTNEYKIVAFRIKLLINFHKGEEKNIAEIEEPNLSASYHNVFFSAAEEKEFYKALILLKNKNAEAAYTAFNKLLINSKYERPVMALNRFASKIQWAEESENKADKKKLFTEAINEWLNFEQTLPKEVSLQYISDKIRYNQLVAYNGLSNYIEFDQKYYTLDKALFMRLDFLELRLKNLVQRKMHVLAEELIQAAGAYHRLSSGGVPEAITKLHWIVDTKDSLLFLKDQYLRILSKSPEELVKIIPDRLNKSDNLPEFVLREVVSAAVGMLTYINSISTVNHEDKYSDLLLLTLNGRIANYGWHAGNARGGYSGTSKPNPGEIDFEISSGNIRITICEALKLSGKNIRLTQSHNFKIFNYDHSRKFFIVLVYYNGNDFVSDWNQYKADVSSKINYPSRYELSDKEIRDISEDFGGDSIKVLEATHVSDTVLYHVFINLNYVLTDYA